MGKYEYDALCISEARFLSQSSSQTESQSQTAWLRSQDGIDIKNSLTDIKNFAYSTYDQLDQDGDGFISLPELHSAFSEPFRPWREKSFLLFLMRRLEDIQAAYDEEWSNGKNGISRVDLQEYFEQIEIGEDGVAQPNPNIWKNPMAASGGINVSDTFKDIHDFALKIFDSLDQDGDGFLTRAELQYAVANDLTGWREKSFLIFLIRNLEAIQKAFREEWVPDERGISRMDLQEYFRSVRT